MRENNLSTKTCQPCQGFDKPLGEAERTNYLNSLEGWALTNEDTLLFREFTMKKFMDVIDFINRIAKIVEEQGHHPDLHLTNYRHLRIDLKTHAIGGLSENDFIVASKINDIA